MKLYNIIPFVRVYAGDLLVTKYKDDVILNVLRVTTATLKLFGYDKGHTSDPDSVTPDLSDLEQALWGKMAAFLLANPEALQASLEAIDVRTLGTSYSTSTGARLAAVAAGDDFSLVRRMIRSLSAPLVGTPDNLDIDTLP